jgi:hypothetical protein
MPMRLITFPVIEDRFNEVLDAQQRFHDDIDEEWRKTPDGHPWDEMPANWRIVAQTPDTGGDPGDLIALVHRPVTGDVALTYRDALCTVCTTGCWACVFVCRVETTLVHLLRGIERGIAQRGTVLAWVTPEAEMALLRTVLTSLYDDTDPTEAAEQMVVALGGPITVLPRAAF